MNSTRTSRTIRAPAEALYAAFLDPAALLQWLPPRPMTGRLHRFTAGVNSGYEMSLFYPRGDQSHRGKTGAREDRVKVRFMALVPARRIVQAVTFVSNDPALEGEMTMEIIFEAAADSATIVTIHCTNLPPGVRPQDNDEGTRISLEQLAEWIARP